jgi:hypothetical protein
MDKAYIEAVKLMLRIAPDVFEVTPFALKGGTAVSAVWRLANLLKLTSELDWLGDQPPAARKSAKPRCEG